MENNAMDIAQFGNCKFCGQMLMYKADHEYEDPYVGATMHCECAESVRYQRSGKAKLAVERVCVTDAAANGFDPLSEDQVNQVQSVCESILSGIIEKAQYDVHGGTDKVLICAKGGNVTVKRVKKLTLEAM